MGTELFLDASFAIALAAPRDAHHERANALALRIRADRTPVVTTRAILLEIGNALGKQRHRSAAVTLLDAIERDPSISIVPLTEELFQQARELYRRHGDKEWGLTDCVSFVVMRQRGITAALTADDHFRQAGFHALLAVD